MNEVINFTSASEPMINNPMAIQTGLTIKTLETV